jgi:hypothetical protein
MPFIGNQPAEAFSSFQKQDFTTSATTSYTLDHPVANGNEIALFINFVRQEPTAAYTASGTSLTLTSATTSSDDMYCVYLGKAVQTVNPPNSSVGSSQVSADLITGQTALGATPADTDELLISDAGTLKRVDYSYLKVDNTPMVSARLSSNTNVTDATFTKIEFDTEEIDTDSAYDNSTNYRFTVPSGKAGKYLIQGQVRGDGNNNDVRTVACHIYKNGTQQGGSIVQQVGNTGTAQSLTVPITQILDLSVSDYIEIFGFVDVASGTPFFNSADQRTRFLITKLIG